MGDDTDRITHKFQCEIVALLFTSDTVNILCGLFTAFMVIGWLVCGVHWFTDILGELVFRIAMILLCCSANNFILKTDV